MQTCTRCNRLKSLDSFHKDKKRVSGYVGYCKPCVTDLTAKHYIKNKERIKNRASDHYHSNKERIKIATKRYVAANKELTLGRQVMKYWPGKTPMEAYELYQTFATAQNNLCAICGLPEKVKDWRSGKVRRLAVDHSKITGQVRGLLCSKHNKAVGLLGDSEELLLSAIDYIKGTV